MNVKVSKLSYAVAAFVAVSALAPIAQAQEVPSGGVSSSYIGTGIGNEGVVVNSRIKVSDQFSFRPAVIADIDFDDVFDESDVTFLIPVTYDLPTFANDKLQPFAGAGLGVFVDGNGENDEGAIALGGFDYSLTENLTANATTSWAPFDDSRVDVYVGVGYKF